MKNGGKENMWKYLAALLVVLFSMGGLVSAQLECADCYANIITQTETQTIQNVRLGIEAADNPEASVAVGNEGLSAAIIVTKPPVSPETAGGMFVAAPFARIDQVMNQNIDGLGSELLTDGEGAKGVTWNKAIQAAWVANQGVKELEENEAGELEYVKEGSYVSQSTEQDILNVYDYSDRDDAKVLNVDNKLAMIVDSLTSVIELTATANTEAHDTQTSTGEIDNEVDVNISGDATSDDE
jgi:hypothetical protein